MNIQDIANPVQDDLVQFESALMNTLHSDIPLAEQVIRYIANKQGKRLRPILVFLTARLHGGTTLKTLQSSIVIEMLHTATLVHDDVVDDSSLRRGSPTVNNIWDNKISVLVGDFLFSKTLTSMLNIHDFQALSIFSETARQITEGELLQIEMDHDFEMDESTYFDLISKKTASLFSASCQLGVLSVKEDERDRHIMRDFGHHLGMAFQIKDDLLDYTGTESTLGKPTGNDIRENKITLPLIHALSQAREDIKKQVMEILHKDDKKDSDIRSVVSFVQRSKGVEYALGIARKYARDALALLSSYPSTDYKDSLTRLVDFTVDRDK